MSIKPMTIALALALPLLLASLGVQAASIGDAVSSTSSTPKSPDYTAGEKAAVDGDYTAAIGYFTKVIKADPTNADANNMLGFSYRKTGDTEMAFEYYNAALQLDPNHVGANEYIGELYLELNDLANAEKHLKVLDEACFFGCDAYTDLKAAISKYKAQQDG